MPNPTNEQLLDLLGDATGPRARRRAALDLLFGMARTDLEESAVVETADDDAVGMAMLCVGAELLDGLMTALEDLTHPPSSTDANAAASQ